MILLTIAVLILIGAVIMLARRIGHLSRRAGDLHARLERLEAAWHRLDPQAKARSDEATALVPIPTPISVRPHEPWPSAPPPLPPEPSPIRAVPQTAAADGVRSQPAEMPPFIASAPAAPVPQPASASWADQPLNAINWEQFMGVKLFAWIGGLALFLGVAFFVKYSFDNNLISPEVRVALSFLAGLALLAGGAVLKRKDYTVTSQTLCATGVLILYAATFASHSIYHFRYFSLGPAFLLMVLITATAFFLSVRMNAVAIAILGLVGGFLTPFLLASGRDNAVGLFGYIALLNVGLMAVALNRRWNHLVLMGAVGTVLTELAWVGNFFAVEKFYTAMSVFLAFNLLFLLAFAAARRRRQSDSWLVVASLTVSSVSMLFVFFLLTFSAIAQQPPVLFSFVLGADLSLLALVVLEPKARHTQLAAGGTVFLILAVWTFAYLTSALLNWALGLYLGFALLHSIFPLVLQRMRPALAPLWWAHWFPPFALLLVMLPVFKTTELTWLLWPCVLLINLLAIGLAALTASLTAILAVLVVTFAVVTAWLFRMPLGMADLGEVLVVIGGFAILFFLAGALSGRKGLDMVRERLGLTSGLGAHAKSLGGQSPTDGLPAQIPALSAVLPFLLLVMVVQQLPLADPSPVFGLALLLVMLLLGVARAWRIEALSAVGLACVVMLELAWHRMHFTPATASTALGWYAAFYLVFAAFPFLSQRDYVGTLVPWVVAALSGPAHFYLVHDLAQQIYPGDYMGLVPAAFAVPSLIGLAVLVRQVPADSPQRLALLGWFGGVALFFITLIFPIQFERQWITLGWALEGTALLWLFHRVPHPGLRWTGVALLVAAFVRLALNPAVLEYHERAAAPVWNWYLYAYGMVTLCLFAGAWLLRAPRHLIWKLNVPPVLAGLGTLLAFLLLNIEIADYFTRPGADSLTFEFSGNFARDMTYSIAWALFALVLLAMGLWKRARSARYGALGLLSGTLVKLFFHDLAHLDQLYRIGALVGVAVIAIVASVLYQRFFAGARNEAMPASGAG